MTAALITGPALEPVSLAEAKAHLRLDGSDDDAIVAQLVTAARLHVEAATRRVLITQSWRVYLDRWPRERVVAVPVVPLVSVDEITVYDADGVPQVLDLDLVEVDAAAAPARIALLPGATLGAGRRLNGIEIDVTAGYGDAADDVPAPLRQAILMLLAHWYEHRSAGSELATATVPMGFEALVAPYRVLQL